MINQLNKFLFLAVFACSITACGDNKSNDNADEINADSELVVDYETFMNELSDLDTEINLNMTNPDEVLLKKAVTKYQDLAGLFPDDPKAADYLFKAADLALTTDQPQKSVKILSRIINDYPNYQRMEDVMFNKASHVDFELRDTTTAKELYTTFIQKYPESELVDDAQSRIKNISLSLDELVEKFMTEMEESPQIAQ